MASPTQMRLPDKQNDDQSDESKLKYRETTIRRMQELASKRIAIKRQEEDSYVRNFQKYHHSGGPYKDLELQMAALRAEVQAKNPALLAELDVDKQRFDVSEPTQSRVIYLGSDYSGRDMHCVYKHTQTHLPACWINPGSEILNFNKWDIPKTGSPEWMHLLARSHEITKEFANRLRSATEVIDWLGAHAKAWPFITAVDPVRFPGYYDVVTSHMDITTLGGMTFDSLVEFLQVVKRIFDNCRLYDHPQHPVPLANELEADLLRKLKDSPEFHDALQAYRSPDKEHQTKLSKTAPPRSQAPSPEVQSPEIEPSVVKSPVEISPADQSLVVRSLPVQSPEIEPSVVKSPVVTSSGDQSLGENSLPVQSPVGQPLAVKSPVVQSQPVPPPVPSLPTRRGNIQPNVFSCLNCQYRSMTLTGIEAHRRKGCKGKSKCICDTCGCGYNRAQRLTQHKKNPGECLCFQTEAEARADPRIDPATPTQQILGELSFQRQAADIEHPVDVETMPTQPGDGDAERRPTIEQSFTDQQSDEPTPEERAAVQSILYAIGPATNLTRKGGSAHPDTLSGNIQLEPSQPRPNMDFSTPATGNSQKRARIDTDSSATKFRTDSESSGLSTPPSSAFSTAPASPLSTAPSSDSGESVHEADSDWKPLPVPSRKRKRTSSGNVKQSQAGTSTAEQATAKQSPVPKATRGRAMKRKPKMKPSAAL